MPHTIMHLKRMNLKYLKSNIACIALVCITCIGFAQPKTVDKIIGVAGNKIILLSELEQQYAQYIAQGNYANPAMRSQIFNQLMTNKMLLYHAMLDSVEVSESQVEEQLDRSVEDRVLITGYTDRSGDPALNLALSEQRAKAVRAYLLSRGIPADRLLVNYYGDSRSSGRDPNERRVEVEWLR